MGGGQIQYVDVMGTKSGIGTIYTAHNFEGNGGVGSLLLSSAESDRTYTSKDWHKGVDQDAIRNYIKEQVAALGGTLPAATIKNK